MNEITDGCCIISAQSGIDTASPQIGQYTDSFDKIKFLLGKNFDDCTLVIITDSGGHVQVINTDGTNLVKETDAATGETTLLWNIGANITADSGVVIYQIAAYRQNGESIDAIWYSKEGRLIVTESISTTDYSTELLGSYPNLLTRLLVQSDAIKDMVDEFERSKVDAEEGMGLSANSFSDDEKQKLAGLEEGAQVNVQSDWNEDDETSDGFIKNKPRFASVALSGAYSDLSGTPVVDTVYNDSSSNAQSGRAVAQAIAALVASAPETLNTLDELASALGDDPNFATTIMTMLGTKADKSALERLEGAVSGVITNTNALSERITTNSKGVASNKNTINNHSGRITSLEADRQAHDGRIAALEKDNVSHKQKLSSLENRIISQGRALTDLEAYVQKEHDDVSASFDDVNLIVAGHAQSLTSHEKSIAANQSGIALIQGQMGDIDSALDSILAMQNRLLGVSE